VWIAVFLATNAHAQEYVIQDGVLTDPVTNETTELSGTLALSPSTFDADDLSDVYLIDDFDVLLGDMRLVPALPIEYMGETAFGDLRIADQIHVDESDVRFFYIRAGGEIISAVDDLVSFRIFEFEPTDYAIGGNYGEASGGVPPDRIRLQGTLTQIDRTYRYLEDPCPPTGGDPPPGDGGGVIISSDGSVRSDQSKDVTLRSFDSFDLSGRLMNRVDESQVVFIHPNGINLGDVEMVSREGTTTVPLLEDLPIEAPEGATVSIDQLGELSVVSDGDIILSGVFPEIAGVTSLYFEADHIFLEAFFEVPVSITSLSLYGRDTVNINGTIVAPGADVNIETPSEPPACDIFIGGLNPTGPADETVLGRFDVLLSSAAVAMEIDVIPWRSTNRIYLGKRQYVWVALLGSEELDVGDIDRDSLRMGPKDAKPRKFRRGSKRKRKKRMVFERDWNRDGHRDLLTVFIGRKLGVEEGDTELCLRAMTRDGTALEGCDEIQVVPRRSKRK